MELFFRELENLLESATEEGREAMISAIRTVIACAKALWRIDGFRSMVSGLGDALLDGHLESGRAADGNLPERDSDPRIQGLATDLLKNRFAYLVLKKAILPALAAGAWRRRQNRIEHRRRAAPLMLACASIDPCSVVSDERDAQELGQHLAALRTWAARIEPPPSTGGRPAIDATVPIALMDKARWPNDRIALALGVAVRTVQKLRKRT